MAGFRCALFTLLWIFSLAGEDPQQLIVKPGQDVTLQCQAPRDADISRLTWRRPDLGSDYVFFFRDGRPNVNFQHSSYRGRVQLSVPEMKDGNVSIVLKNVTFNDTGTYQCQILTSGGDGAKLINTKTLNVTDSGHTDGRTGVGRETDGGDKDGGSKNGGSKDLRLANDLGMVVVIAVLLLFD
ncbi:butyrophilin subfamily 2 member A1-like [Perca flavescens]|uniref:butyrophilin subfamily 2 member A1-like n=1 Tax=Perca flavescens TaxID=8167 RepID=UPI00106E3761|nr:butyrophilin subfamily 2 member A1-like [Perca flavescens]